MGRTAVALLIASTLLPVDGAGQSTTPQEFVGTTPCDTVARQFLGIPASAPCERIAWQIALSGGQNGPATFQVDVVSGIQVPSSMAFVDGGTRIRVTGTWSADTSRRPSGPSAAVYRFTTSQPMRAASFAPIGDTLLHLLDAGDRLMVGNPGWSYTLNRKGGVTDRDRSRRLETAAGARENAGGVFEGRTPCQQFARQLNAAVGSECTKIKWRLTLAQDPATQLPTTYKLEGFIYRQKPRTGKWTILRDAESNDLVYRLEAADPRHNLLLLRADDNILYFVNGAGAYLVGDGDYSFTLNRVAQRQPSGR